MKNTLEQQIEEHLVEITDAEGRGITGRITGAMIAFDDGWSTVYLTKDERVLLHAERRYSVHTIDNPEEDLRERLTPGTYTQAMDALGIQAIIDL